MLPAANKGEGPLHVVQIHFDTATFDENERDLKMNIEAQLSLIGGTMGLFCGFSIFTVLEIIYCIIEYITFYIIDKSDNISFRIKVKTKFRNTYLDVLMRTQEALRGFSHPLVTVFCNVSTRPS